MSRWLPAVGTVLLLTSLAACSSTTPGTGSGSAPPTTQRVTTSVGAQTPSATPAVSASTPSPVASQPSPLTGFDGFVGSWYGHGRALTVAADGTVKLDFRTYVNCTATVTTGCDKITGNTIYNGGHVAGHIASVINATTVMLAVTSTSVPAIIAVGEYRFGHDLGHHAVALFGSQFSGVPFCGADAPTGYCGA